MSPFRFPVRTAFLVPYAMPAASNTAIPPSTGTALSGSAPRSSDPPGWAFNPMEIKRKMIRQADRQVEYAYLNAFMNLN
jgi:hypothetical protein